MKNLTFYVVALATLALLYGYVNTKQQDAQTERPRFSKEHRIGEAIQQEFERTKDPALNSVPRERLRAAYEKARQKLAWRSSSSSLNWEERGPNNVGGRTRAILFDANDASGKTVFAAGVSGGLWKTSNIQSSTPNWIAVDDFFDNMAITCIVQDPANPNIMYFGTGEGWFNNDAVRGSGIWKSTDAGATWTALSATQNVYFSFILDLLMDANGTLYASTLAKGVQRSTNGGASWEQVLGASTGMGNDNRAADLELAADGTVYATLGVKSSGGIFKSTSGDRGTWTNITPVGSFYHRIEIACAPSDANRIYALCQSNTSNDVSHIYRSTDGGNSWATLPVPAIIDQGFNSTFTKGQAWYNLIAAVDPANADVVYIGGVDALRSTNGGNNWEQITTWSMSAATGFTEAQNIHGDHHAIVFAPGSSSTALWGTDGGLYYSTNLNSFNTKPSFTSKNKGYNVTQFYTCAIHPQDTDYFLGGTQDNATRQFTAAGLNDTEKLGGGDGGYCHIDQDNPNIQIISYLYNNYYVSTNGGNSFSSRFFGSTGSFINPGDYDDNANKLYAGNSAGTYLRWNDPAQGGSSHDDVSVSSFNGASPTAILASPNVNNRVYFGLNSGSVVQIDNAHSGTSQTGVIIRAGGIGSVSCIVVDENDEDHILVTYSNYGVDNIWETLNGGTNWQACDGDLPDMPVRWAMFAPDNPSQAIVATELGIWMTDNLYGTGTIWNPTSDGMANVRTDMLQYRASDKTIIAATHGRGIFSAVYNDDDDDDDDNDTDDNDCIEVANIYREDFETFSPCSTGGGCTSVCELTEGWVNENTDNIDWRTDTGGTASSNTGPSADYNPGNSTGNYLYLEASSCFNKKAVLTSPCFNLSELDNPELTFAYHMNGSTMGNLKIEISEDGGSNWLGEILIAEGNQYTDWKIANINLSPSENTIIRIIGTTGPSYRSDIAIDDIAIQDGDTPPPCPDNFAHAGQSIADCIGTNRQLSASGGVIYQWLPEDGLSNPNIPNPTVTITSSRTYTVFVTDADGCEDADQVSITAHPLPVANAGNNATICLGLSTSLNGSGGTDYSWSPAYALSNANIANPVANPAYTTTYTLTVANANGCSSTDEVTVVVDDCDVDNNDCTIVTLASPYRENFETFSACSPTDACAVGVCQLRNDWVNATNGLDDQIDWRTDFGGTISNYTGPLMDFNPGSPYGNYLYTEASGCYGKKAVLLSPCFDLSALNNPELEFAYNMYGTSMGDLSVSISENGGASWSEEFLIASGNQSISWKTINIDLPASNNVMLKIIGTTGSYYRSDLAIDDIQIKDASSNMDWDGGDLEAEFSRVGNANSNSNSNNPGVSTGSTTGQAEMTGLGMTAFPNPVRTELTVSLQMDNDERGNLILYDVKGQQVWASQVTLSANVPMLQKLQVSGLPSGLYLLVFEGNSGMYSEKIIVE